MDAPLVLIGIPTLALALALLFVVTTWHTGEGLTRPARAGRTAAVAIGMALWLVAQAAAAQSGWLGQFQKRPPPLVLWFGSMIVGTLILGWSPFGRRFADRISFVGLIGFQAFRLPLELVMHRAAVAGIMPSVMSFTGYNFDIVTGITAIPVAWYVWKRGPSRRLIALWNFTGQFLLLVIVMVAFAASPVFRAFGDAQLNTWVVHFPYVWIAVMVGAALFGHVITLRKLLSLARKNEPAAASRR